MSKKQKINFSLFWIILIGSFFLNMTMFRSGSNYNFGIGFWGPNGHDAIWHLSLINQLKQQVPPQNPIYSGTVLQNYHWGFDFFAAKLSQLSGINILLIYFKILPITFSILLGFLSYKLSYLINKNKISSLIFVFLIYFSGSFGWIITLLQNGSMGGESLFWSMQSASILLNPPFALSVIILLFGLILWIKFNKTKSIFWSILIGIIFAFLSCIKVYAGILIGVSLSLFFILDFLKTKKISIFNLIICITTGIISLLILYFLGALNSNNQLLEFKPFWFIHSMIDSLDKLYLPRIASFRYDLSQHLNFYKFPFFIGLEFILFLIFIIGNSGTRIFGFINLINKIITKKCQNFDILITIFLTIAIIIPTLFIQKGTSWNTIQFFYYFLFFLNLYLAQFLGNLWQKNNILKKLIVIFILLLTIPSSYATVNHYFSFPSPSSLPVSEIKALNFLKNQPNGYVLTYPYNKYIKNSMINPVPLYAYETTAYVSAFSEKVVFLEDEMNLSITGYDWQLRRQEEEKFFSSTDKFFTRGFLLNNKIDYIYLVDNQNFSSSIDDLQINEIFNQGQVRVYKVRR